MQIEGSRRFKLLSQMKSKSVTTSVNSVNTSPSSVVNAVLPEVQGPNLPSYKSSNLSTGSYDDLTEEQQNLYNSKVNAARAAVSNGTLQPVEAGDGHLKVNARGKYAPCILMPNANSALKTCPLVNGVARCGHYPDQCPLSCVTASRKILQT